MMLSTITLAALFTVAHSALSGDYCYTDSKICTALASSGYTYLINNETLGDRAAASIPKIEQAYGKIAYALCKSDKIPQCFQCYGVKSKPVLDVLGCFEEVTKPEFNRTIKYLTKDYENTTISVKLDGSRTSCYMNLKTLMVFGGTEPVRTFVKPAALPMPIFSMWMMRVNMVLDYVQYQIRQDKLAEACKAAGDSEILELASAIEFYGLNEDQLREEVVCRCLKKMK